MKPQLPPRKRYLAVVSPALLAGAISWLSSSASAQPLTDSLALAFKEQGDRAIAENRFGDAEGAYSKGDRIQHHPSFDFNLARALQGLERYAEALDALERFDSEASPELRAQVPGLSDLLNQLKQNVGQLRIDSVEKVAKLTGNGRDLGQLRKGAVIRCNRGTFELRVEAEGHEPIAKRVVIEPGRTTTVHLDWVPIDSRAKLSIAATVAAANVSVDGKPLGQTPLDVKLTPGTHRLRLDHSDYQTLETDVVLSNRESRALNLEMSRHAPIWSKWWFWTGAAVVVAGIVVTGIALSTTKSADPGDIQPGIVAAPLVAPR